MLTSHKRLLFQTPLNWPLSLHRSKRSAISNIVFCRFSKLPAVPLSAYITGASHASHLGCPSAYGSRVSYVKKRQVWKSRSETDWPHLGISLDFSTEKNRRILILTSTCWQEISLSNTVELTTVTPQKQKICRFKHRFFTGFWKFQRFHCVPTRSKSRDAPWLGGFVFMYVCWRT